MALSEAEIDATTYEEALTAAGAAALDTASLVGSYSHLLDPCEGDPCASRDNAIPESCEAVGSDDFTCECEPDYEWEDESNQCETGPLESLQSGPYVFTAEDVNDSVFGGQLENYLEPKLPITLDETVDIPSLEQVNQGNVNRTVSLDLGDELSVDVDVQILRQSPTDDFYTLTGTAQGSVSVYGYECGLTGPCNGQLTPETTTTVRVTLSISDPVVTGLCSPFANTDGTIEVHLRGEFQ
jgi:hypothetical protein